MGVPSEAHIPEKEFASPQEALAHFGVKGMRWGVRNEGRAGAAKTAEPTRQEIKSARRAVKSQKAAVKTQKQISKAEIEAAKQRLKQAKEDYKTMPERDIARHRTTGEKIALTVLTLGATVAVANLSTRNFSKPPQTATNRRSPDITSMRRGRNPNLVPKGMKPAHLANVGEQVSVYWK